MTTADKVLVALEKFDLKKEAKGYRCNSPLRPGANSHSFTLVIDPGENGEKGCYNDFRSGEKGSLYDLAKKMGIDIPSRETAQNTHRSYTGMSEYAQVHGGTLAVFQEAKWQEVMHQGRKALIIPTATGKRYRFIDGKEPYYKSESGYTLCWYGLKKAVERAQETAGSIVICNGEASVVVATSYGIAACTMTAGEKAEMPDPLLSELKARYSGAVMVAYDCDLAGRTKGPALAAFLRDNGLDAHAIDLGLDGTGDLADFCKLHGDMAVIDIDHCPTLAANTTIASEISTPHMGATSWHTASEKADLVYDGPIEKTENGALILPFRNIRKFGGMATLLEPGNVLCIAAPTGQAKTSVIETLCDHWRQQGNSGIMWGPEIESEAYVHRAVQRHGGPTYNDVRIHKTYRRMQELGMPDSLKRELLDDLAPGQSPLLTKDQITLARSIKDSIDHWPGTIYWIPKMGILVDEIITQMLKVKQLADPIHRVAFAILDYAQLTKDDTSASGIDQSLARFKAFCVDEKLVGIIASQVTKSGSMAANASGYIDLEDLHYARGDYFDIVLTFFRQRENGTDHGPLSGIANVNVVKNRLGRMGSTHLALHPTRDVWLDTVTANVDKATITQVPM